METIVHEQTYRPVADACRMIAGALVLAFFLPVLIGGFGINKLVFVNIEGLGKGNFFNTVNLLYPLIAAAVVYLAGHKLASLARPLVLLVTGLLPLVLNSISSMTGNNMFRISSKNEIMILLILSVIGIFSGSKLLSRDDHTSSRLLGGISGVVFILLMLLPIASKKPPFFALFDLFKSRSIGGSQTLLGIILVGVFSAYIWASYLAILNLRTAHNQKISARKAVNLVKYGSLAIPAAVLLSGFSSMIGFFPTLFLVAKFSLWLGGFFVLISVAVVELFNQLQPKTLPGGKLLEQLNSRE